jgi:hypothetical protein
MEQCEMEDENIKQGGCQDWHSSVTCPAESDMSHEEV